MTVAISVAGVAVPMSIGTSASAAAGTLALNTGNTAPDVIAKENGNKCEAHGSIQGRFVCTIAYGQGTKKLSWSVK